MQMQLFLNSVYSFQFILVQTHIRKKDLLSLSCFCHLTKVILSPLGCHSFDSLVPESPHGAAPSRNTSLSSEVYALCFCPTFTLLGLWLPTLGQHPARKNLSQSLMPLWAPLVEGLSCLLLYAGALKLTSGPKQSFKDGIFPFLHLWSFISICFFPLLLFTAQFHRRLQDSVAFK